MIASHEGTDILLAGLINLEASIVILSANLPRAGASAAVLTAGTMIFRTFKIIREQMIKII